MRAHLFYAFGAGLGLSETGMEALLNGGELPQIEERGPDFVHVLIDPRHAAPGYALIPVQARRSTVEKWLKELQRLKSEEQR